VDLVDLDTPSPPPHFQLGSSARCSKPMIDAVDARLLLSLILVVGNMHKGHDLLSADKAHFFMKAVPQIWMLALGSCG
jgi:hypothetical protein